jgi:L-alanine-DL-glutamate epimerase-like enolase superfamily enzyme
MNINRINPSTLKITDMRFADIDGAPKRCTLMKLYTNQGLVGYGEVRDASSRTYAEMLKSRILGENPCNVEKIFRRIKQFGGDSRQACADFPPPWNPTKEWDREWSNDRRWS